MDQTPNKAVLGGVGCSAFEMQKPKKIFVASKEAGGGGGWGGVQKAKKLVYKVGLPQIVLALL